MYMFPKEHEINRVISYVRVLYILAWSCKRGRRNFADVPRLLFVEYEALVNASIRSLSQTQDPTVRQSP